MATKFNVWIDSPIEGTNVYSQSDFNDDDQRISGYSSGQMISSKRLNTILREVSLITTALMDQFCGSSTIDLISSLSDVKTALGSGIATSASVSNIISGATIVKKAEQDESGNNIKSTYAASLETSGNTITLKNKNGVTLSSGQISFGTVDTAEKANTIKAKDATYKSLQNALLEMVYPVGSIYMSVNSTSPASFLGGTWVAWGSGKVPVGVDTADTAFDTVEETGGGKNVTLTTQNMPSHVHTYYQPQTSTGSTALTIAQMPRHAHQYESGIEYKTTNQDTQGFLYAISKGFQNYSTTYEGGNQGDNPGDAQGHTHSISMKSTTNNTGSAGQYSPNAISVLQPYITCYMWKRTA